MLSMLFGICMVVTAADMPADTPAATRSSLHSQGIISFGEGKESVVIDSADLYTLAERLDRFKVLTVEQLGAIGTYLSRNSEGTPLTSEAGVYAVHQEPSSGSEIDPRSLSFKAISEGIAASQSIPADAAAYGMESGTTLYQGADGKLYYSEQEGADPIENIQAATAENLSAGTAAWVNGHLILGTGGDNKAYYDQGYQEGSDEGDNGDDEPEISDNVNKAHIINMTNATSRYVVQEDLTDVFLCFSRVDGRTTPILNSDETLIHVIQNTDSSTPFYQWDLYYAPKLARGTMLTDLCATTATNIMNMMITIEGSNKDGKVNGLQLTEDYVVEEDLTDVFLYTASPKNKVPYFTPVNDQKEVSYKLLKDVSYHYTDVNKGAAVYGCFYYIPVLKAGTKISNIDAASSYLVY